MTSVASIPPSGPVPLCAAAWAARPPPVCVGLPGGLPGGVDPAWRYAAFGDRDGRGGYAVGRLLALIKACGGDVAGPAAHSVVRGERGQRSHIVARVSPEAAAHLLAVLAVDHVVRCLPLPLPLPSPVMPAPVRLYDVTCRGVGGGGGGGATAVGGPGAGPGATLQLDVCCRNAWRARACDFDADLLGMNATGAYLFRDSAALADVCADRLGFVLSRIRDRRFSALTALPQQQQQQQQSAIDALAPAHAFVARVVRASQMLDAGWVMDDVVAGPRGWLLAPYGALRAFASPVRLAGPAPFGGTGGVNDVCPLCHEPFRDADRVLQLGCRHVFHLACDDRDAQAPVGTSGILTWVAQGHCDCPLCRQ